MIEILFNMKTYIKLGITTMNFMYVPQLSYRVLQTWFKPPRSTKLQWIWGNPICFDTILWKSFVIRTVRWCQLHALALAFATSAVWLNGEKLITSVSAGAGVSGLIVVVGVVSAENELNAKILWFNCIEWSYEEYIEEVRWGRHILCANAYTLNYTIYFNFLIIKFN